MSRENPPQAARAKHGGPRVAIVGGGLAGLAAAARLVDEGATVELFEARRRLGGRAGSFAERAEAVAGPKRGDGPESDVSADTIDHGQHVSLGCCTALVALLHLTELADTFETHRRLNFIGPDGRARRLSAAAWLPAPLHLLPSLLGFDFLSLAERRRIVQSMWAMKNLESNTTSPSKPNRDRKEAAPDPAADTPPRDESVAQWLQRHGQSDRAIDRFWSPVLVSALSETLDHASLRLSRKAIVDGLLASRRAYELQIPRLPLFEIFDRRLGAWLESRGVAIHRLARVARIEGDSRRVEAIVFADARGLPPAAINSHGSTAHGTQPTAHGSRLTAHGSQRRASFDAVILAVPWNRVAGLLSREMLAVMPELQRLEKMAPAAIATVHLAYDRPITELAHAVLVGRLGQWIFAKPGNRYQVVVSASHRLVDVSREELGLRIQRELADVFPAAAAARLLHSRVVVQPRAVFSACPGVEDLRPPQQTPIDNLALAGDWTATGWPATMEGAVRSGNAAAEMILGFRDKTP
ncbi:MAG: FAD-dependent oxidoreductase [Pirellulales bacterium]|nr:FAD-dependent oxidoreductase [Pirellulales bacterium]